MRESSSFSYFVVARAPTTRCQPITPLDSPLVLFFVAVSHGVIGEDSLMVA